MRVVTMGSYLIRFADSASDRDFWAAQRAAKGQHDEATAKAVARAFRAVDVVGMPRVVRRRNKPGVEWSVWACRWADQAPITRQWFDDKVSESAIEALVSVFRTVEPSAYEASLALELAGVLESP